MQNYQKQVTKNMVHINVTILLEYVIVFNISTYYILKPCSLGQSKS